jgi:tripartite-type tricarboxylate transporter receptor subunit TctC
MTALTRRTVIAGLAGLAATPARADWPDRPITIIHGFPAGGPSDLVARILADGLSRALGQQVIVETRPGASGTTAVGQVARAAPDGYTLCVIPSGHAFAAATYKKLPYRPIDDFTFISLATEYPYLMATYAEQPFHTVAELIETARSRSKPLLYGTPGNGSGPQLAIELFAREAKVQFQHIPYRGSAPAVTDLVGKRIDFMMDPPAGLIQFVREGRLRALAVTSAKRYPSLPDVPTIAESGVPGYVVAAWQGLIAPAGLPEPILDRLNTEVVRLLKDPVVGERLRSFGNEPSPCTPDEFKARCAADIAKWTKLVDDIHFEKI